MSDLLEAVAVCADLLAERDAQIQKWGRQSHRDGTNWAGDRRRRDAARYECDQAKEHGLGTWRHILLEEVHEALAESERDALRNELVQVAAVCVAWIEDLDSRAGDRAVLAAA